MALSSALGQKRIAEEKTQCPLEIQIINVTSQFHKKLSEQDKINFQKNLPTWKSRN